MPDLHTGGSSDQAAATASAAAPAPQKSRDDVLDELDNFVVRRQSKRAGKAAAARKAKERRHDEEEDDAVPDAEADGDSDWAEEAAEDEGMMEEESEEEGEAASLASSDSSYMAYVWEESDSEWELPGQRQYKKRKVPKLRRRSGAFAEEEGEEGFVEEEDFDAEEDVDVDQDGFCATDLGSFGGREALRAAGLDEAQACSMYPPLDRDDFRGAWGDLQGAPSPGQVGFNEFAVERMRAAGVAARGVHVDGRHGSSATGSAACPRLQPHQESVAFLLHPESPVSRLLVDHPTGAGKTREMIQVLDQLFFDDRPKVPIFPKQPIIRNFYAELLRWPSKYRDYYCCVCPGGAFLACQDIIWRRVRNDYWPLAHVKEEQLRALVRSLRDVLEMKGAYYEGRLRPGILESFEAQHPGERFPCAPLRALGYASAGGANTRLDGNGRPMSSFFKVGFALPFSNPYDGKVVLMDEVHNLVRTETQYATQLATLRELLRGAKRVVLAGFTGTPILSEPSEGRTLLEIIKGGEAAQAADEGFMSSLATKPFPLFPRCSPEGIPDVQLTEKVQKALCRQVSLAHEALHAYVSKAQDNALRPRRLRAYCNMYAFVGSYHDGQHSCKGAVLENPLGCAPKLQGVAVEVVRCRQKSLVLISRGSGYRAMLDIMRQAAAAAQPPFEVASIEQLAEFNSSENLRGDRLLCMVADAAQCSEGISFNAVRRLHLVDVPDTPTIFAQQCGRASRMLGHSGLRPEEQTVGIVLHVAVMPPWAREPLGAWVLRSYCRRKHGRSAEVQHRAQKLLSKLRKVGIKKLEELHSRLMRWLRREEGWMPSRRARQADECDLPSVKLLSNEQLCTFLHSLGLKSEAASIRAGEDTARLLPAELHVTDGEQKLRKGNRPAGRHPLLRGLHWLMQVDANAAKSGRGLCMETADEKALQQLAGCSKDHAAALARLREVAVDRKVLGDMQDAVAEAFSGMLLRRPEKRRRIVGKRSLADIVERERRLAAEDEARMGRQALAPASPAAAAAAAADAEMLQVRLPGPPVEGQKPVMAAAARQSRHLTASKVSAPQRLRALGRGVSVRLCRLQGAPELNNLVGQCESFDETSGRWLVVLSGGILKKVKAENLESLDLETAEPEAVSSQVVATQPSASAPGLQLAQLREMSVAALKQLLGRLRPGSPLHGAYEKEELCRMVLDGLR
eukprot:TRINITY_DN26150_c0_g1_i1.p1 TRINITY_DN26150_c0_g1~~TRINITY_DN26150_c0_g1_i1.p1  ORF type:complete len:1206 (-),score=318.92 TRINITY_DN26150_c0_g1_i1:652-4227(-)